MRSDLLRDPKKLGLLLLLLAQNTGLALFVKASKNSPYISSTAVILNEIVKLCVSGYMYLHGTRDLNDINTPSISHFIKCVFEKDNLAFIVPSLIYATQNNLVFIAMNYIDAALYQVLSNLKIISTALFTVFIMGKKLHRLQWMALFLLAIGEAIAEGSAASGGQSPDPFMGTVIMSIYAALSGFAGVFTEKKLKQKSSMNFWLKTMIQYFWGAVVNILYMLYADMGRVSELGFFSGYTLNTWIVVFLMSFGGILVSVVITQFDNIVKVYVTCCSLFLTSLMSYLFFEFHLSMEFALAAFIVSISILVYSDPVVIAASN